MRTIETFKGNEANKGIEIEADDKAEDGASHNYSVFFDTSKSGHQGCGVIQFQDGTIKKVGHNGITDEALLSVLIDRLRGFQSGPFSCRENALALTKLEEGMHWLNERTRDRVKRGVEGVYKA